MLGLYQPSSRKRKAFPGNLWSSAALSSNLDQFLAPFLFSAAMHHLDNYIVNLNDRNKITSEKSLRKPTEVKGKKC